MHTVFISVTGFRKVLQLPHVHNISVITSYNKFLVYHDTYITAYSLDLLGRVAMQMSPPQPLDASRESITNPSDHVFFMKLGRFAGQSIRESLVNPVYVSDLPKLGLSYVRYTGDDASLPSSP